MIHVDIYSDFICPFCYIGKRQLDNAIQEAGLVGQVNISYKAFRLHLGSSMGPKVSATEYLANAFDADDGQIAEQTQLITQYAEQCGLSCNFKDMLIVDTANAHRLNKLAESMGLADAFVEAVMQACLGKGVDINDPDTLLRLCEQAGIPLHLAKSVLESDEYAMDIAQDQTYAALNGISGVPFFVINNKYGVNGAQELDIFVRTLKRAVEENNENHPSHSPSDSKSADTHV